MAENRNNPVRIGTRAIGDGNEPFVIAEVGNAHDGSYNTAHAFIDAVAETGVDAIKFQTHIAAAESTPGEPFRVKFSHSDATRYDYWRRMEFTAEQWASLKDHAEERGLIFMSSPFSPAAVELLESIGVVAWKVASGETNNLPMIDVMAQTEKPVLISTGMSYQNEIQAAVDVCATHNAPFMLFHCTTSYPCPPEQVGLNVIGEMEDRYQCPIGLSDHSGDMAAPIAAVALGADAVEVHVCLSRDSFGPDVPASLTPAQLKSLTAALRSVKTMRDHPVDKDEVAARMEPLRKMFCKSIVFTRDMPAGTTLTAGDMTGKKPGDGVPIARVEEFVGRTLVCDVNENGQLNMDVLQ